MNNILKRMTIATLPLFSCATSAFASSQKVCSSIEPEKWRTIVAVPREWTENDCRSFSMSIGGTHYKLGCIFSETIGEKYSWSAEVKEVNDVADPPSPPRNCGW